MLISLFVLHHSSLFGAWALPRQVLWHTKTIELQEYASQFSESLMCQSNRLLSLLYLQSTCSAYRDVRNSICPARSEQCIFMQFYYFAVFLILWHSFSRGATTICERQLNLCPDSWLVLCFLTFFDVRIIFVVFFDDYFMAARYSAQELWMMFFAGSHKHTQTHSHYKLRNCRNALLPLLLLLIFFIAFFYLFVFSTSSSLLSKPAHVSLAADSSVPHLSTFPSLSSRLVKVAPPFCFFIYIFYTPFSQASPS